MRSHTASSSEDEEEEEAEKGLDMHKLLDSLAQSPSFSAGGMLSQRPSGPGGPVRAADESTTPSVDALRALRSQSQRQLPRTLSRRPQSARVASNRTRSGRPSGRQSSVPREFLVGPQDSWVALHDRVVYGLKVLVSTCRSKPSTLLLPLLLFALLCGCGLFGCLITVKRTIRVDKDYARQAAAAPLANAILGQLSVASMSVSALTSYVMQHPHCSDLDSHFAGLGSSILEAAHVVSSADDGGTGFGPLDSVHSDLQLVFQVQAYPAMFLDYNYPPLVGDAVQLNGLDLLTDRRNITMLHLYDMLAHNNTIILGPVDLVEGFKALFFVRDLLLPAPNMTYDWGCGRQPSNCSGNQGPCFLPDRGLKLWGRLTSTVSLDTMQAAFGLHFLAEQYKYSLEQLPTDLNPPCLIARSDGDLREPVVVDINFCNLRWRLSVEPFDGWYPFWAAPCIASVVTAATAVSLLVLWLLVSRERHDMLLCSMLPQRVVRQLWSGRNVVESFPGPVTILFSDIVSYCEVASQLTPLQVLELLNDLYTVFDKLTLQHGCYKVETIGDAFMATAGCPYHEDPMTAAVRMAGMASAMIQAVSTFNSKVTEVHGIKLKIRIGLHSGPVVAGVVGRRMPRYSLFGDTVNMASRMETTSAPMCVHLSGTTAALLQQAGATVLPLTSKAAADAKESLLSAAAAASPAHLASSNVVTFSSGGGHADLDGAARPGSVARSALRSHAPHSARSGGARRTGDRLLFSLLSSNARRVSAEPMVSTVPSVTIPETVRSEHPLPAQHHPHPHAQHQEQQQQQQQPEEQEQEPHAGGEAPTRPPPSEAGEHAGSHGDGSIKPGRWANGDLEAARSKGGSVAGPPTPTRGGITTSISAITAAAVPLMEVEASPPPSRGKATAAAHAAGQQVAAALGEYGAAAQAASCAPPAAARATVTSGKADASASAAVGISGSPLVLQERGDVLIKGKGLVQTYWLVTSVAAGPLPPPQPLPPPPGATLKGYMSTITPMPSRRPTGTGQNLVSTWQWQPSGPSALRGSTEVDTRKLSAVAV